MLSERSGPWQVAEVVLPVAAEFSDRSCGSLACPTVWASPLVATRISGWPPVQLPRPLPLPAASRSPLLRSADSRQERRGPRTPAAAEGRTPYLTAPMKRVGGDPASVSRK